MSSTIPLRTGAPPNAPLPALPIVRSRKALPGLPKGVEKDEPQDEAVDRPASAAAVAPSAPPSSVSPTPAVGGLPRPHTRSFTASGLPTPKPVATPSLPSLNTTSASGVSAPARPASPSPSISSAIPTPGKTLRKTASIGQFPLPPKAATRIGSLPPSPLGAAVTTTAADGLDPAKDRPVRDPLRRHQSSEAGVRKPKARSSGYGLRSRTSNASMLGLTTPSLLNGTGDSNLIASADPTRKPSDSHLILPSPDRSARSSLAGSYNTDATSFEEDEPEPAVARGRRKSQEASGSAGKEPKDGKGNVVVSVRVRPDANAGENASTNTNDADGEWLVDGRRSLVSYRGREGGDYRYDNVFSPHDNNARVYDHAAKRLVRRVMEGYHGTVFAYGMTGTGKTFSMQGTATSPGVIPQAISDIFSYIRENPSREFLLRVSYLEIYNEKIYDLLSQSSPGAGQAPQEEIKLREDSKRGVYATPLKEEIVQSPNQLLRVIARGDVARRTSSTQFNARSSRSHAVVQIVVESRERSNPIAADGKPDRALPGGVLVSTLSLIDLAGSEKAADSKERRQEGAHINKSLLTLGTVIARLSGDDEKEGSKEDGGAKAAGENKDKDREKTQKHLPYRDSKLTRLLQPALSGNSLVSILCTIQLSSAGTSAATVGQHTGETLNTLKFASRAKNNIVSHAKRNESNAHGGDAGSRALLDRYRLEIQELRTQLDKQTKAKEGAEQLEQTERDRQVEEQLEREERIRHEEQMLEMQLARTALKERISHLNRLILSSKSLGVNSNSDSRRPPSGSTPVHRMSSGTDFGRPVSVRSRNSVPGGDDPTRSGRESGSLSHGRESRSNGRESSLTMDTARQSGEHSVTTASLNMGVMAPSRASTLPEDDGILLPETDPDGVDPDEDVLDGSAGLGAEGEASLAQQNRMLQADLADKNRYIATLEKRLLQARRTSHSRVSMQFAARGSLQHDDGSGNGPGSNNPIFERQLQEKDREIDELRAKLDDQMRMVNALRSAARKREMMLDSSSRRRSYASESHVSDDTARPATAVPLGAGAAAAAAAAAGTDIAASTAETVAPLPSSTRSSLRSSKRLTNGSNHMSNASSASRSSLALSPAGISSILRNGPRTTTPTPLSPVALLSPSGSGSDRSGEDMTTGTTASSASALTTTTTSTTTARDEVSSTTGLSSILHSSSSAASRKSHRRRSVDEMTQLLDQMIQDKVDSGHVVRGSHGTLRVKRDTLIEPSAPLPALPAPEPAQPVSASAQNNPRQPSATSPMSPPLPPPSATKPGYEATGTRGLEFETLAEVEEMKG